MVLFPLRSKHGGFEELRCEKMRVWREEEWWLLLVVSGEWRIGKRWRLEEQKGGLVVDDIYLLISWDPKTQNDVSQGAVVAVGVRPTTDPHSTLPFLNLGWPLPNPIATSAPTTDTCRAQVSWTTNCVCTCVFQDLGVRAIVGLNQVRPRGSSW
ncbi:hypothetical protein VNO77_24173 [Canavalia gladiata]|uniref:Uncharacterized protein n=1 Tax=Canavalia gladiata TaxID=3824 RepID=A0AAN9QCG9_CANGL